MKTMICLVLDRSGSMGGRENDVVGGVNAFIEEQRKLPDPACMAFVRFDSEAIERFQPMQALAEVKMMTKDDFKPRAGTPLLDAIGQTITALEEDWKREQPDRAIMLIVTDGEENHSREYTKAKIKEMIESRQASGKWGFIYLGANVDAFAEGGSMGFSRANTAGYQNTAKGTQTLYAAASNAVRGMRLSAATEAAGLGRNVGEDEPEQPVVASAPPQAPSGPQWQAPKPAGPWTPPAP